MHCQTMHMGDSRHCVLQASGSTDDPVVTAYGDVDRQLNSLSAALDLLVSRIPTLNPVSPAPPMHMAAGLIGTKSRLTAKANIALSSPCRRPSCSAVGEALRHWHESTSVLCRTSAATALQPRWQRSGLRCSRTSPAKCRTGCVCQLVAVAHGVAVC